MSSSVERLFNKNRQVLLLNYCRMEIPCKKKGTFFNLTTQNAKPLIVIVTKI